MSDNRRKDDTRRWQQEIESYEKSLVELRRMEGVEASMKAANEDLPKMGENFNKRKAACDQVVKQAKDVSGRHIVLTGPLAQTDPISRQFAIFLRPKRS